MSRLLAAPPLGLALLLASASSRAADPVTAPPPPARSAEPTPPAPPPARAADPVPAAPSDAAPPARRPAPVAEEPSAAEEEATVAKTDSAARELLVPEYPPPSAQPSLALTGALVFAGWYGLAAGASFAWPDARGSEELRIPVAGPWMAVADAGCDTDDPDCSQYWVVFRTILMVMDGVGQAGGLAVLGEAAFLPTQSETVGTDRRQRSGFVRAMPFVTEDRKIGLGVTGAF